MVLLQPRVNTHCRHCVVFEVSPLVPQQRLFNRNLGTGRQFLCCLRFWHFTLNVALLMHPPLLRSFHRMFLSFAGSPCCVLDISSWDCVCLSVLEQMLVPYGKYALRYHANSHDFGG